MKLSFRDLKQQKFTIEAEPSETIGEVKEKIAAEKGWETSTQKLIYSGKILADANTVESYKIEEKGFIVCMVSKPKVAPVVKAAPPATPAQSASTPAQPPAPQAAPATTASNPPATPTPAQPATAGQEGGQGWNNPSAMLMGNRNEETIREMEAMGFERSQIDRALRAAYFNPDRAIDYLLTGIPENVQADQRPPPTAGQGETPPAAATGTTPAATEPGGDEPINLFEAAAAAQGGQGAGRGAGARGGAGAASGLAGLGAAATGGASAGGQQQVDMNFLRNSPHFQQLRQLVQQNPAMLEPILQQVAEGNPQLAQMIGQNQDQFLQLLAEDITGNAIGGMGDTGALPPGAQAISVTEEERDAIERLCRLGFSRDQVIQAYFACDKNEELAANFLFEQPEDDDGPPPAA